MIDPATGSLTFAAPAVRVSPAITRSEFLSAAWAQGATDWVVNEPWHSWRLPGEYLSHSLPWIVVLYFQGERLTMVDLCHNDPRFGSSWSDHSVEKERARQASHDRWLSACVGERRSFPWGTIWSGYDDRSGGSFITLRF